MIPCTSHLTAGYSAELEQQIRNTRPGMAHLADSGPPGATCGACQFLSYWRHIRNDSGDILRSTKSHGCEQFFKLTGKHGPAVSRNAGACRHFVERKKSATL
jgi:hypothetical protein